MGKYSESEFHDSCGTGFIVETSGNPSRRVIELSIEALKNMSHRGASGSDERSTDGTGILTDIPFSYFRMVLEEELDLNSVAAEFGIAMLFTTKSEIDCIENEFDSSSKLLNLQYLGKRMVPINKGVLGETSKKTAPLIIQLFFGNLGNTKYDFETRLYILRKTIEHKIIELAGETFICSLSSKTIVYKGMMKPNHLARFYSDLNQPEYKAKLCIFHERFSTNTTSTWQLAQPFRMLGHNGEINTIKGNRLWMKTREGTIKSEFWGETLNKLKPIVSQTGSDSYSLDNIIEFLVKSGRSVFHSMMMIIPEPYSHDDSITNELKDFYAYHENLIEPWDGPAALVFTDGDVVGAKLDRNGLRPLRYTLTRDGLIVMASEAGVVTLDENSVLMHHHMKSGESFAVKLDGSGVISNEKIRAMVANQANYCELVKTKLGKIERSSDQNEFGQFAFPLGGFDRRLRIAFGFDKEDIEKFIIPMAETGRESIGSMGDDTPIPIISNQYNKFYDYFKQQFAQVTNPPIDSIREKFVTSLNRYIGYENELISDRESNDIAVGIEGPVLSPREVNLFLEKARGFGIVYIKSHLQIDEKLVDRLQMIRMETSKAVAEGARVIILTDEGLTENYVPIPMLLALSAVHQHLVATKLRNNCALVCFTGDVCEDHHVAALSAFGASAVYPYMAYEIIREHFEAGDWTARMSNYRFALEKGLLKIMAKMGISTLSSYHGSMLFQAIGLSDSFVDEYFPSIKSILGGMDLQILTEKLLSKYRKAFNEKLSPEEPGKFRYRKGGEAHGFSPSVFKQIHAVAHGKPKPFQDEKQIVFIRDLLDFIKKDGVRLESVEPVTDIVKRFGLGAVSFGAISEEVHRTLARAASILGIRSNTGEGGEQKDRYSITNPDKTENCYTKQIASGRFGITPYYLSAAREIQIKMGQGAKPGEGGQLPGEKVTLSIANDRHTTPGVPLISPPPHHDIYSIEDLAQLIYDLRKVNPRANISVKLVSQFGIGIIASGVVKAGADSILISGYDGGTGASPLGSIKHTGLPWEIGLTEVHRTLISAGLRDRVTLRVDGGLKTGKDIVTAALLGAEEFDFGTSALVSLGCVMVRQCHLNTCPAGIATQDPNYKKKFKGKPENLVNFLTNVAEEVRLILARIGYFSLDEIIGRNELLIAADEQLEFIKERNIDLKSIIPATENETFYTDTKIKIKASVSKPEEHIDEGVINEVRAALMSHSRAVVTRVLKNTERAVGTRLSGLIAFLYGSGEFKGHIQYKLDGVAGQSLGAFLVDNIELRLCGAANDYVGKGMSGGLISIRFPKNIRKSLEGNTIIGNVALYGATGGEVFISGKAGERFAVRNSGAAAVLEGAGNHCCEYMTRGLIIVLGDVGKNFGAGMTGGFAFLYDLKNDVAKNINNEYVKIATLTSADEDLLKKYIINHEFHTGSTIAKALLHNWESEKESFVKIVPKAIDIIDFQKIYEERYKNRMLAIYTE